MARNGAASVSERSGFPNLSRGHSTSLDPCAAATYYEKLVRGDGCSAVATYRQPCDTADPSNKWRVLMAMKGKLDPVRLKLDDEFASVEAKTDWLLVTWNSDTPNGNEMMVQDRKRQTARWRIRIFIENRIDESQEVRIAVP